MIKGLFYSLYWYYYSYEKDLFLSILDILILVAANSALGIECLIAIIDAFTSFNIHIFLESSFDISSLSQIFLEGGAVSLFYFIYFIPTGLYKHIINNHEKYDKPFYKRLKNIYIISTFVFGVIMGLTYMYVAKHGPIKL